MSFILRLTLNAQNHRLSIRNLALIQTTREAGFFIEPEVWNPGTGPGS